MANKWFETVAVAQARAKKRLPSSVYGALIDQAHQRGLRVAAHLFRGYWADVGTGAESANRAPRGSPAHGRGSADRTLAGYGQAAESGFGRFHLETRVHWGASPLEMTRLPRNLRLPAAILAALIVTAVSSAAAAMRVPSSAMPSHSGW